MVVTHLEKEYREGEPRQRKILIEQIKGKEEGRNVPRDRGCKVISGYWFVYRSGECGSLPEASPRVQNIALVFLSLRLI